MIGLHSMQILVTMTALVCILQDSAQAANMKSWPWSYERQFNDIEDFNTKINSNTNTNIDRIVSGYLEQYLRPRQDEKAEAKMLREILVAIDQILNRKKQPMSDLVSSDQLNPIEIKAVTIPYVSNSLSDSKVSKSDIDTNLVRPVEMKRETARWNHLRGMWGKRSIPQY